MAESVAGASSPSAAGVAGVSAPVPKGSSAAGVAGVSAPVPKGSSVADAAGSAVAPFVAAAGFAGLLPAGRATAGLDVITGISCTSGVVNPKDLRHALR